MAWQRFEGRKPMECDQFIVSICRYSRKNASEYLSFNKAARTYIIQGRKFCDVFLDPPSGRIALRFLADPTDCNSYKVLFGPRISATRILKGIGAYHGFIERGGSFTADLKHDPAQQIWWFSVAPLMPAVK